MYFVLFFVLVRRILSNYIGESYISLLEGRRGWKITFPNNNIFVLDEEMNK